MMPEDHVFDRLGADVTTRAIAHTIRRNKRRAGFGPLATFVVAEAQPANAIIVDLDDEVSIVRATAE